MAEGNNAASKQETDKKKKEQKAQQVLDKADGILKAVDASYIFTVRETREFPQFVEQEIVKGALLGKGGFSGVHEVDEIVLLKDGDDGDRPTSEKKTEECPAEENKENGKATEKSKDNSMDDDDYLSLIVSPKEDDHKDHYDVTTAREFMSKQYLRHGSARYAIKKLRPDLGVVDRARGAVDLAIEIKFLRTIWHPNIIKMRGYSKTPRVDSSTFLILDRLYGTLDDKIETWEQRHAVSKSCCGGASEKDPEAIDLLKERLLVAYDLSSALNYLHDMKLLYRDLKPENVGFDIRGDVKLFDFGLMKSLERADKIKDGYGYKLSGKTGSIPYMAPEVALGKPYDREADVFSFAVLLWEILSVDWAFNGYDARQYFVRVCAENQRLPVQRSWPAMVRVVIQEGWDPNPQKRPNMKRVGNLLRGELEDITTDTAVLNRTQHMMNRSKRSRRILNGSAGRRSSTGPDGIRRGQRPSTTEPSISVGGKRSSMKASRSSRDMYLGGDMCGSSDN